MSFLGKFVNRRVVLITSVVIAFVAAERMIFGVFLVPIQQTFAISRRLATLPMSVQTLVMGLSQPFFGAFIDAKGPKKPIFLGTVLITLSYVLGSLAQNIWQLSFSYGLLMGVAGATVSVGAWSILIGNWFPKEQRAKALGVINAGMRISPMLFAPLSVMLIGMRDFRFAFLVLGGVSLVTLPLAWFFLQEPPADKTKAALQKKGGVSPFAPEVRQVLKTKTYWLLLVIWLWCGFEVSILGAHLPALGTAHGFPAEAGGTALGLYGIAAAAGVLLSGWAADRFGRYKILVAGYLARSIGVFLLAFAITDVNSYYVITVIAGIPAMTTSPLITLLIYEIFGREIAGRVIALSFVMHQVAGTFSSYFSGWLFDITGSYTLPFAIAASTLFISAFLAWRLQGVAQRYIAAGTASVEQKVTA